MTKKTRLTIFPLALLLALASATLAHVEAPNFGPAIYADGAVWGTKGLSEPHAPNGRNDQSFDKLFIFVNGAAGQMAVSEAAPGNPACNGGRVFPCAGYHWRRAAAIPDCHGANG